MWGHPLVIALTRVVQRLRAADLRRPWVLDTAVAVGVFLLFGAADLVHDGDRHEMAVRFTHLPVAGVLALQAGLVLPLLWRRRMPSATFAAVLAVFLIQWLLGAWLRADVALLIALYSLALHGRLRHLPWACAAMAGVLGLVSVRVSEAVSVGDALFFLFSAVTAALALGLAVRIRRSQLAGLRERAARLEIERDQRSKLAAAGERTRVAREMHDIVGHNLSVMITLADGGAYAALIAPERGKEALELIGETGRQALGELRRMLGVLRDRTDAPELSPQPGIADIDALCARIRAAGPKVRYRTIGELDALDRGVQLTAYRIVQEALTNSLRHAGAETEVRLALTVDGTQLRISADDTGPPTGNGRPAPANQEGHGLAGMAERAALYGGSIAAGPRPGGGWTVQVTLDLTPLTGPPGETS
ncbi:histidine kinase [Streptomyces sp. RKAG293]|uniref:sensor histidine kinase n=1 Tax=Streptomyces sp. RKAG293 TaxID=2893403 RepID=UPI0020348BE0|nr:histidine kinase [Streptomyces sp. RKAG293]MCM2417236.1 histidine kinase [Streptomyces sp. RKAG293]